MPSLKEVIATKHIAQIDEAHWVANSNEADQSKETEKKNEPIVEQIDSRLSNVKHDSVIVNEENGNKQVICNEESSNHIGRQKDENPNKIAPNNDKSHANYRSGNTLDKAGKANGLLKKTINDRKAKKIVKQEKNKTVIQYFIYSFIDSTNEYQIKEYKPTPILFQHLNDPTSFYNGNISINNPNPTAYLSVTGTKIYLMSAFIGFDVINTTNGISPVTEDRLSFYDTKYDYFDKTNSFIQGRKHVVLNAWMDYNLVEEKIKCCLLLQNQSIVSYMSTHRMIWYMCKKQPLMAAKMFCHIPDNLQTEAPVGAMLSLPSADCYSSIFMNVEYPKEKESFTIAVCAKIAYGELLSHRVVEWLETQRSMGVDKVVFYFYNLNKETMYILKHYMKEGFVDLLPFDLPQPGRPFVTKIKVSINPGRAEPGCALPYICTVCH